MRSLLVARVLVVHLSYQVHIKNGTVLFLDSVVRMVVSQLLWRFCDVSILQCRKIPTPIVVYLTISTNVSNNQYPQSPCLHYRTISYPTTKNGVPIVP